MNRLNRSKYTLEDALNEINFVEGVLDNMGAREGLTLWGRVVEIRTRLADAESALETANDVAKWVERYVYADTNEKDAEAFKQMKLSVATYKIRRRLLAQPAAASE